MEGRRASVKLPQNLVAKAPLSQNLALRAKETSFSCSPSIFTVFFFFFLKIPTLTRGTKRSSSLLRPKPPKRGSETQGQG